MPTYQTLYLQQVRAITL